MAEVTSTNLARTRCAFLRSTIALMARSSSSDVRSKVPALVREFHSLLVHKNLNGIPISLIQYGITWKDTLPERKAKLSVPDSVYPDDGNTKRLMNMLKDGSDSVRKAMWTRRIGVELEENVTRTLRSWYPFFLTLTIDQKAFNARSILSAPASSSPIVNLIKRLEQKAGVSAGVYSRGKWSAPKGDVFRYCGVIEHGASCLHHHAHYILLFRECPHEWLIDPIATSNNPQSESRCGYIESYWEYGLATCHYWRFAGDPWTALGFRMPGTLTGGLLPPAYQSGSYVAKYLDKEDRQWNHRIRTTRGFGMSVERAAVRHLSTPMLVTLQSIPTWPKQFRGSMISEMSLPLLKRLSVTEIFSRRWASTSSPAIFKETQPSEKPFSKMLKSVEDGARPWRMSSQDRSDWLRQEIGLDAGPRSELLWSKLSEWLVDFDSRRAVDGLTAIATLG